MKKVILFFATAVCFTTAHADSIIDRGTEDAVNAVHLTLAKPQRDIFNPDVVSPEGRAAAGACHILNHTPLDASFGVACVRCGSTYVSVTWYTTPNATFGLHPREPVYQGHVVSNCNW